MTEIENVSHLISTLGWYQKYSRLPESDIAQAEARLGIQFPPLLRTFYRELGGHPLFKNQGCYCFDLVPLQELVFGEEEEGEASMILFTEGMGYDSVWECMRRSEFDKPEPRSEFWVVDYMEEEHWLKEGLLNVVMTNILSAYRQRVKISGVTQQTLQPSIQSLQWQALPMLDDLLGTTCYGNPDVFLTIQTQKNFAVLEARDIGKLASALTELHIKQCSELQLFVSDWEDTDIRDIEWLNGLVDEESAKSFWLNSRGVSLTELKSAAQKAKADRDLF